MLITYFCSSFSTFCLFSVEVLPWLYILIAVLSGVLIIVVISVACFLYHRKRARPASGKSIFFDCILLSTKYFLIPWLIILILKTKFKKEKKIEKRKKHKKGMYRKILKKMKSRLVKIME